MEVHHHAHAHGKKKFKDYFLEFFMLFLAVTLGFLAENLREHLTEQKKEKEYIASFVDDLQNDTTEIGANSKRLLATIHGQDSLLYFLQHYADNDSINKRCYRYFLSSAVNVVSVTFNQNTLNQLLNTGSVRLIGRQSIIDSIMAYNALAKEVNNQYGYYNEQFKKSLDYSSSIFNFSYMHFRLTDSFKVKPIIRYDTVHFKLVDTSPAKLQQYSSDLILQQNLSVNYLLQLQYAKANAKRLIAMLNDKYHLKKEE